ncbi:MAG: ABC transporter substrate-binding protein [Cyanobacteria bacterium NC_groundwater_1444_Ag_S-0.65um_54_12]|nr:ABC transporter substrate-binding protein [Cyanobacteria bacterium NC_groundwater_1444_Ag_S-0.65um_54_12]
MLAGNNWRRGFICLLLASVPVSGCEPTKKPAPLPTALSTASPTRITQIEVVPPKVEEPVPEAIRPGIGRHGGTLTGGMISDPKTFNYVLAQETSSSTPLGYVFEGLAETNVFTGKMQPALAEKWTVSPDNRTYVFTLRRGLRWSDGHPLTADDVDFTFNKLVFNKDIPTDWRDIITIGDQLPTVKKLDELRIEVKTPKPFAPFLRTFGILAIMPKHILAETVQRNDPKTGKPVFNQFWTVSTDVTKIPGSGPFIFQEFVPAQRLVYRRNPYYWRFDSAGNRLPYLAKLVIVIVKDQNAGVLKFQSGETDILFIDAPLRGQDFAAMKPQEPAGNFTIYKAGPDFGTLYLTFNQTVDVNAQGKPYVDPIKQRWFRNRSFRQAIAHAIDKLSIIKNVYQQLAIPQIGPESQTSPFYYDKVPVYEYDLAKAQQILTAAGYKKDSSGVLRDAAGHPIAFTLNTNSENNERKAMAQILKTDLDRLGMKVKFQPITFNVLVEKTAHGLDWEAIIMGFTGSLDPALGRNIWNSGGRVHMFNQKLPTSRQWQAQPFEKEIDDLFEAGATTLDEAKRKAFYDKFQVIVARELPYLYIVNRVQLYPMRNVFGNVMVTPIGGPVWNLFNLYRTDLK